MDPRASKRDRSALQRGLDRIARFVPESLRHLVVDAETRAAFRVVFNPTGPNAVQVQLVLKKLMSEAFWNTTTAHPNPTVMGTAEGRRQLLLVIKNLSELPDEVFWAIQSGRKIDDGRDDERGDGEQR